MARLTDIGQLDAYLATTPGGLYAVVAIALSTGADTGLIFTMQVLRLFAALMLVPVLARLLRSDPGEEAEAPSVERMRRAVEMLMRELDRYRE